MRYFKPLFLVLTFLFLLSCQGPYDKAEKKPIKIGIAEARVFEADEDAEADDAEDEEEIIDMDNKGVGPVASVDDISDDIDQGMADAGEEHFNATCVACHQMDSGFVGPGMKGITERRSPEWIMNMILDPDQMLEEDPIAIKLLEEYGAPMPNMGLTEDEAREVLEYFRSYDG